MYSAVGMFSVLCVYMNSAATRRSAAIGSPIAIGPSFVARCCITIIEFIIDRAMLYNVARVAPAFVCKPYAPRALPASGSSSESIAAGGRHVTRGRRLSLTAVILLRLGASLTPRADFSHGIRARSILYGLSHVAAAVHTARFLLNAFACARTDPLTCSLTHARTHALSGLGARLSFRVAMAVETPSRMRTDALSRLTRTRSRAPTRAECALYTNRTEPNRTEMESFQETSTSTRQAGGHLRNSARALATQCAPEPSRRATGRWSADALAKNRLGRRKFDRSL